MSAALAVLEEGPRLRRRLADLTHAQRPSRLAASAPSGDFMKRETPS
jgi:hypothetical protein